MKITPPVFVLRLGAWSLIAWRVRILVPSSRIMAEAILKEAPAARAFGPKDPFGAGALLKMSSAQGHAYEVLVDGTGHALLGRVESGGKRIRLCEASSNTEAGLEKLLAALKNSEGGRPL